jgi:hypothetical protein
MKHSKADIKMIGKFVKERTGKAVVYAEDSYPSIIDSKLSCDWGWPQGVEHNGFKVVVSQLSPRQKDDIAVAFYDFIPIPHN